MTIWIFVGCVTIASTCMTTTEGLKFAFTTQASCEEMIKSMDGLKCKQIKLIDAK